jgi:hypothetical protein
VIVAVAVGLLIASFAYQPAHPLIVAFANRENPLSSYELDPLKPADRRLGFTIVNEGLGDVTVRSVRAVGSKTAAVDVVVAGGRPIAGVTLAHGAVLFGKVVLPRAACAREPLVGDIPAVVVYDLQTRVETLGSVRTQRFEVVPPARLYCH